jgi:heme exporter protein A
LGGVNARIANGLAAPAVDAQSLTRRFGRRWALRGVSLRVEPGEIVGVEGQNGSGKSTLLRVLSTALRPTGGRARVFGSDVASEPDAVRASVAFLAHFPGLYDDLTAEENLRFAARMLGADDSVIAGLLARVGLEREAREPVRTFSAGMQRRLSLARLLMQRPRLLLLDEPYNNFDPQGIALVNSVVRDVRDAGGSAMIVLHDLHSAGDLMDRVIRLRQGLLESDLALRARSPESEPMGQLASALAEDALG